VAERRRELFKGPENEGIKPKDKQYGRNICHEEFTVHRERRSQGVRMFPYERESPFCIFRE
jgi:hypothetical protein